MINKMQQFWPLQTGNLNYYLLHAFLFFRVPPQSLANIDDVVNKIRLKIR